MAIRQYLAMTAAELQMEASPPPEIAWMACHFSPYRTCASNLPQALPGGSLLILDDFTPICGHDPEVICQQLQACAQTLQCAGVLLDFQRPEYPEASDFVRQLTENLSCPVCVSQMYAADLSCPVLLPPIPLHIRPEVYLSPWDGREIWLEMSPEGSVMTLTRDGCTISFQSHPCPMDVNFPEETLHCHYHMELLPDSARFTLWRTPEDQAALLEEAEALGVTHTIGLYQEWKSR